MRAPDMKMPEIEIEKGYSLMRIFNLINTDQRSAVFIYEGVRFWRENDQFMIQSGEKIIEASDVVDYDEFRRAVMAMKTAKFSN
jgi:hypothetical protein